MSQSVVLCLEQSCEMHQRGVHSHPPSHGHKLAERGVEVLPHWLVWHHGGFSYTKRFLSLDGGTTPVDLLPTESGRILVQFNSKCAQAAMDLLAQNYERKPNHPLPTSCLLCDHCAVASTFPACP